MAASGHGTTATIVEFAGKDALFARIRADAQDAVRREPDLAGFLFRQRAASRNAGGGRSCIASPPVSTIPTSADRHRARLCRRAAGRPRYCEAFRADLLAVFDRDPACKRLIEPVALRWASTRCRPSPRACALQAGPATSPSYPQSRSVGRIPGRHQSGREIRQGHLPRSCDRPRHWADGGSRRRRVDPARRDAQRHRARTSATDIPRSGTACCSPPAQIAWAISRSAIARRGRFVVLSPVPHNTTVAGVPARVVGTAGCAEPGARWTRYSPTRA